MHRHRRFWLIAGLLATFALPWRVHDSGLHALDPELPGQGDFLPVRDGTPASASLPLAWVMHRVSATAQAGASQPPAQPGYVSEANDSVWRARERTPN